MSKAQLSLIELNDARYLLTKRQFNKSLKRAERGLGKIKEKGTLEYIRALLVIADIHNTKGRYKYNEKLHQEALTLLNKALLIAIKDNVLAWDIRLKIVKTKLFLKKFSEANILLHECMSEEQILNAHPTRRVTVLITYSEYHYLQNKYDEAADFIHLAFQEKIDTFPKTLLLDLYDQAVRVYLRRQEYSKIYKYGNQVLELGKAEGDVEREFVGLNAIAIYHASQQDFKMAMLFFKNALDKSKEINYKYGITFSLINIATIYANLFNYEEALNRYQLVLDDYEEILDDSNCLIILNNIGNIHYATGETDEALEYFKKSVDLARDMNYQEMEAHTLVQLSRVYLLKKSYEKALKYALQSIELMKEIGTLEGQHIIHITLGNIYYDLGDFDKAMKYVGKGIVAAKQTADITSEMSGYRLMSNIYREKGDFKRALDYQMFFSQAQEKYTMDQLNRQIVDLKIRYDFQQKQKEFELLKKYQNKLVNQHEKIKEKNEQLIEANKNLTQFAYAVSHDLKEPLRMIGSYSRLIQKRYEPQLEENAGEFFSFISKGVEQMSRLLDDLLKYATIGNEKGIDLEKIDLNEVFQSTVFNLQLSIQEAHASVTSENLPTLWTNRSYISQLFQNLIGNAVKFKKVGRDPIVQVLYRKADDFHHISFKDNGIGIPKDSLSKIFQAFQRLHKKEGYKGTGIGLSICIRIVERLGGKITVESKEDIGSTFTVAFPEQEIGETK